VSGRLLTVAEASAEFFVPERTIRTWIGRGFVRWRDGYLDEDEVAGVERKLRRGPRERHLLALADSLSHDLPQANPSPSPVNLRRMSK
jgi:hypothetical protein